MLGAQVRIGISGVETWRGAIRKKPIASQAKVQSGGKGQTAKIKEAYLVRSEDIPVSLHTKVRFTSIGR